MFCGSYEVFGTKEMLGSSDDCTGSPQRQGEFMDNSNFFVLIFDPQFLKSFFHLMYIQHFEKNNGLKMNLRSILRIFTMSHFFDIFTMGAIAYLSFLKIWIIMPKVHRYPSTFKTRKITTSLVCWTLPPTRDMDYHIREILETCFKLSGFTLEQIFYNNFCWECLHYEHF